MSKKINEAFNRNEKGFKEISWIAVKNLSVVWAQAQRPLDEKHANKIADNFDPEMFGTLAVTKPNGHGVYHLIDGHHRRVAVQKLWGDDEKVPCQIFDAEDPARAAELFDSMNTNRKKPQPVDIFRVRVTAKDEDSATVNKIVLACGYHVGHRNKQNDNNIICVAALMSVYKSYGPETLKQTLDVITSTWGLGDNNATHAVVIKGIGEFLSEYRNVDYKRLREVVASKYTPAQLHGAAKSYRELHGGSMPSAIKNLIANTYNDGLRSRAKKLVKVAHTGDI